MLKSKKHINNKNNHNKGYNNHNRGYKMNFIRFLKINKNTRKVFGEREIKIINHYFGIDGEPMTLEMIGEEVGLTKERVRQIKESTIRKVRNNLGGIFDI